MASKRIQMTTSLSVAVQVYPYDFSTWVPCHGLCRGVPFRRAVGCSNRKVWSPQVQRRRLGAGGEVAAVVDY